MHYPCDYGFITGSLAPDGDPLDAMVMVGESTFPGCAIRARPVGVLQMQDEAGLDDKILCVPANDPKFREIDDIDDVPDYFKKEVEHFFSVYKELEHKAVQIGGWHGVAEAWKLVAEATPQRNQGGTL
ncbi:MAG: inorganic diphosphatase [Actinobacteria bacterium]|nr:inorganic diphosphatase [Actinomycetota bacterium]